MSEPQRHDEQPGTKTQDPAEGKRTDPRATPASAYPAGQAERPGTKTADPVEGGETSSGAERTPDSPRH